MEGVAKEADVHSDLVKDFVSFYYGKVRKDLSNLEDSKIYLQGLGTFCLRKTKLEKAIKRNRDILGNINKREYKGYEKHIAVKDKLKQMEKALKVIQKEQIERKEWKEKNK
tara:strand:- start:2324 stop:2656 length:333 start_codon:yes stop_codon:yes gene_type:complete